MSLCSRHSGAVVPDGKTAAPKAQLRTFAFPSDVVDDPSLSLTEKRAVLAEWASDRSAVASCPTLRRLTGTTFPVTFSSVMDALHRLDERGASAVVSEPDEEELRRVIIADFARSRRNDGVAQ